jgi:hypothetical protein
LADAAAAPGAVELLPSASASAAAAAEDIPWGTPVTVTGPTPSLGFPGLKELSDKVRADDATERAKAVALSGAPDAGRRRRRRRLRRYPGLGLFGGGGSGGGGGGGVDGRGGGARRRLLTGWQGSYKWAAVGTWEAPAGQEADE